MNYQQILPGEKLKPYVKCFYLFESDAGTAFEDTVFPTGSMEIIFNLGEGIWQSSVNGNFQRTPLVELWGQITQPLAIKSLGKHTMLGIRFFTHSAACFLNAEVWAFNNHVYDLKDLLGPSVNTLHSQLRDENLLSKRIDLIERFLIGRLSVKEKKYNHIKIVSEIVREMQSRDYSENIGMIALRYNVTSRYLQKLFLQHIGITPKLYFKINRFQKSLQHIVKGETSLTSIAYDCGYFDQSHLIRDFKSFTGITPSAYSAESFPMGQALPQ